MEMIFLINYDRRRGLLVDIAAFSDGERDNASLAKMDLEISLIGCAGFNEVVLLEADSEDDLRRTHSRYFKTLAQLKSDDVKR